MDSKKQIVQKNVKKTLTANNRLKKIHLMLTPINDYSTKQSPKYNASPPQPIDKFSIKLSSLKANG